MKRYVRKFIAGNIMLTMSLGAILPTTSVLAQEKAVVSNFSDISENYWAKNQINQLINEGIINGFEDGTFKPSNKITRAQFVKIINKVFGFTNAGEITFTDINENSWYKTDVAIAIKEGYINGFDDNTFRPDEEITREQIAKIIGNILNIGLEGDTNFSDDASISPWAKKYVKGLVNAGIINGYEDGSFKPKSSATRAEATVLISNIKEYKNIHNSKEDLESKENINSDDKTTNKNDSDKNKVNENKTDENKTDENKENASQSVDNNQNTNKPGDNNQKPNKPGDNNQKPNKPGDNSQKPNKPETNKPETNKPEQENQTTDNEKVSKVKSRIDSLNLTYNGSKLVFSSLQELQNIESNVNNVRAEYELLSQEDKNLVTNYNVLQKAVSAVTEATSSINTVIAAINRIPSDITEQNFEQAKQLTNEAQRLYNSLANEYKNGIESSLVDKINEANKVISSLSEKINASKVQKEIELALSEVSYNGYEIVVPDSGINLDSASSRLSSVKSQYDSLNSNEKSLIENYNHLERAISEVEQIKSVLYPVYDAIGRIPTLDTITEETLENSERLVKDAEDKYKSFVSNYSKYRNAIQPTEVSIITTSREKIERLKAQKAN